MKYWNNLIKLLVSVRCFNCVISNYWACPPHLPASAEIGVIVWSEPGGIESNQISTSVKGCILVG